MDGLRANLLRRPHGAAELVADGLRVVAVACIVVAGFGWGVQGALSLALVSLGMLLPRALGVRPGLDIAFGVFSLVSVWSSVIDLYVTVKWWDLPMHFFMTGLAAAITYILLVRFRVIADAATLPRPRLSATIVTATLGTSFAAIWEMWEWFAKTYIDEATYVGYRDTIGDVAQGVLGSVLAGLLMPVLAARSRSAEPPTADAADADRSAAASDGPPPSPVA